MQKIPEFTKMLAEIEADRGITKDVMLDAIAQALISACRRNFQSIDNLRAVMSDEGVGIIYAKRAVVTDDDTTIDPELQIPISEAKKIKSDASLGDEIEVDVTPKDFGRFAAITAKQVIVQRMREAEKETAFDEYSRKQGTVVIGVVQRREPNGYLINLGRTESLLPRSECIANETLRPKERVKIYLMDVRRSSKGPMVAISRTHPGLIRELFRLEVPEIASGVIEIKGISREAGRRSKIAILSHDKSVPAIGTCVGQMGSRIQNIVREIGNERIDIVEWSDNPALFIANSLAPAKILRVILEEREGTARVVVPDDQLSLPIGRDGQNVRLAAKLSGWKIDIMGETQEKAGGKKLQEAEVAEEVEVPEVAETLTEVVATEVTVEQPAAEVGDAGEEKANDQEAAHS